MLDIFNKLEPFFEDCYRRVGVREYARVVGVSPPTASTMLKALEKEGVLKMEKYKRELLFYANKDSRDFIDLSRIYWRRRLSDLLFFIEKRTVNPSVILFGSLAKGEAKGDSDIDLAVFGPKKTLDLKVFEKGLGRAIQIFMFNSLVEVRSKELANNIANGYVLSGKIRI